jgi:hypothetical protein
VQACRRPRPFSASSRRWGIIYPRQPGAGCATWRVIEKDRRGALDISSPTTAKSSQTAHFILRSAIRDPAPGIWMGVMVFGALNGPELTQFLVRSLTRAALKADLDDGAWGMETCLLAVSRLSTRSSPRAPAGASDASQLKGGLPPGWEFASGMGFPAGLGREARQTWPHGPGRKAFIKREDCQAVCGSMGSPGGLWALPGR